MRHPGHTEPFRAPDGTLVPGSIAEVSYLHLGGVDQWTMIRGARRSNPLLLMLHGGPGLSDTPFFRRFNASLETHFTVVYWDQRGTGRSFDRHIPPSSMTVERFIADLDELIHIVREHVPQQQLVIMGHSWGSALGVLYAARHPTKVQAYVGVAQYGDCAAAEAASYRFALAEAERRRHRKAIEQLRAIGPPPYGTDSLLIERKWTQRFDGQLRPRALWTLARSVLGAPESSLFDLPGILGGFRFSLDAMWGEVSALNLLTLVPALPMPVFFFVGRRDHWIPPETSVAYFDQLRAPAKTIVWFDHSGHEPFVDEPAKFNAAMTDLVLPALGAMSPASCT